MLAPADYEYDVFLSYQRESPVEEWVQDLFHPKLKQWLNLSSPQPVKVFFDKDDVEPPADWTNDLSVALLRSRCMVAVLTPQYFTTSEFCRAEWNTMREREQLYGLPQKKTGLIFGVTFSAPNYFPTDTKKRQLSDFTKWSNYEKNFEEVKGFLDFKAAVTKLAKQIVAVLPKAPACDPSWTAQLPSVTADFKIEKQRF